MSAKIYPGRETNRKHAPRFYGPFVLGETRGPNAFEVKGLPKNMHPTINVSYLKPFIEPPERFRDRLQHPLNLPVIQADGEPEWEVEEVLDTRTTRRGRLFLVKWTGYTRTEWLPIEDMANCAEAIVQYFASKGEEVPPDVLTFLLQRPRRTDTDDTHTHRSDDLH